MKKLWLIVIAVLAFVLISCGDDNNKNGNDTDQTADNEATDAAEVSDESDEDQIANDAATDTVTDAEDGEMENDEENDEVADSVTDEENDEMNDDDTAEIVGNELIGKYSDSWGGTHIISNTVWDQGQMSGKFNIESFDSDNDFIIAQNDSSNAYNPDKWSRFDYVFDSEKLYICQIAYDKETMEEALNETSADRTKLDTGCSGFGWTELSEIVEESIDKDSSEILEWANAYESYTPGSDLDDEWKVPENVLGQAEGTSTDVVSLGNGGSIVLTFDKPVTNGDGYDFAVFENSINETFLELAFVEVSSNGTDFVRFDNYYLGLNPVSAFGSHDSSLIWGFAGKFMEGLGTQFDLADLSGKSEVTGGTVDLTAITHIRIVDVLGDGTELDTLGDPIYDPYPTTGSAGFDLDAVGVMNVKE